MIRKSEFNDIHAKQLDVIVDCLKSYVYNLNELQFVLQFQPDRFKAFVEARKLLCKFYNAGVKLPDELVNLINQYLLR